MILYQLWQITSKKNHYLVGKRINGFYNKLFKIKLHNGTANGQDVLDVYYKAYNEQDIEKFIQNVIDGIDPMKEARDKFYQERLLPPNGKLPSENIIDDIIDSIKNQRVLAE